MQLHTDDEEGTGTTLSIACADRVLVLKGTAQEVQPHPPRQHSSSHPRVLRAQMGAWDEAVSAALAEQAAPPPFLGIALNGGGLRAPLYTPTCGLELQSST